MKLQDQQSGQGRLSGADVKLDAMREFLTRFEESFPDLAEALRLIVKHVINAVGAMIDLHSGNMMMRGNTLVIIDPAFHNEKPNSDISAKSPRQLELPGDWKRTVPPAGPAVPKTLEVPPMSPHYPRRNLLPLDLGQRSAQLRSATPLTPEPPETPKTSSRPSLHDDEDFWNNTPELTPTPLATPSVRGKTDWLLPAKHKHEKERVARHNREYNRRYR